MLANTKNISSHRSSLISYPPISGHELDRGRFIEDIDQAIEQCVDFYSTLCRFRSSVNCRATQTKNLFSKIAPDLSFVSDLFIVYENVNSVWGCLEKIDLALSIAEDKCDEMEKRQVEMLLLLRELSDIFASFACQNGVVGLVDGVLNEYSALIPIWRRALGSVSDQLFLLSATLDEKVHVIFEAEKILNLISLKIEKGPS